MSDDGDARERGILSEADRAYLRGETAFSNVQSERNARARIRDRLFEAVRDFELLVEHLDEHDRELVFEKRLGNLAGPEAFDALVSAQALLYQGIGDTDLDVEAVLNEAVNVAEAGEGRAATVDLDVTYERLSPEGLLHKLEEGGELSLTELAYLHGHDDVSRDRLARHVADDETVDDGRIQSKVTEF
ncbi:hypothetical protein [Halolamina salifodinae]|uniref:Domain of unknown function domain-containing protein n=1 Tax=Halolamina salifodinae TaxID=1202767 RepID=A0A8T4GYZ4_9EURY|nr:hypothetical protein [Halolamina salifodinae]MBP1986338.1 hypothetical protein [Halolamina salifodinae]